MRIFLAVRIIVVAAVCVALAGCDTWYVTGQNVDVRVEHVATGEAVVGATVTLLQAEYAPTAGEESAPYVDRLLNEQSAVTDAEGNAVVNVQGGVGCSGSPLYIFTPCPGELDDQVTGEDFVVFVEADGADDQVEIEAAVGASASGEEFTVTILDIGPSHISTNG